MIAGLVDTQSIRGSAPPLGRLSATRSVFSVSRPRWERMASKAWYTRKLAVLLPVGADKEVVEEALSKLQLHRASYRLENVPVGMISDPAFDEAVQARGLCCLSHGRGLHVDTVLGLCPRGPLVVSLDGLTYERLGIEKPAPGDEQLQKLARLMTPGNRRHVCTDIGISKTRLRRAASIPAGPPAVSRWKSLVDPVNICGMDAYCDNGTGDDSFFARLLGDAGSAQQVPAPVRIQRVQFRNMPAEAAADLRRAGRKPGISNWVDHLVCSSEEADYGEACEDYLDWLGALHMGVDMEQISTNEATQHTNEEGMLWVLGETLLGPAQLFHAMDACARALGKGLPWFALSFWGDEDAPLSYHGGAHGFDLNGSHHMHFLAKSFGDDGETKCLIVEVANTLHSTG